jgi:anti-sigma factor RsiW
MNRHLSDDDLIARLYEAGDDEAESHLETCPECAAQWSALKIIRRAGVTPPPVQAPASLLAAQRRKVLERIAQPQPAGRQRSLRWAPAVAAAFLLMMGVFLYHPSSPQAPVPAPPTASTESDMQLFTDVYAMEQEVEPRAAAPIHELFEEGQ